MVTGSAPQRYQELLSQIYDLEQQILELMPRLVSAANTIDLRFAFEGHLAQTRMHPERIAKVLRLQGREPNPSVLTDPPPVIGMIATLLDVEGSPIDRDVAIAAAAQDLERHEIAAYQAALGEARELGDIEGAYLLEITLSEENDAEQTLIDVGRRVSGRKGTSTIEDGPVTANQGIPSGERGAPVPGPVNPNNAASNVGMLHDLPQSSEGAPIDKESAGPVEREINQR